MGSAVLDATFDVSEDEVELASLNPESDAAGVSCSTESDSEKETEHRERNGSISFKGSAQQAHVESCIKPFLITTKRTCGMVCC